MDTLSIQKKIPDFRHWWQRHSPPKLQIQAKRRSTGGAGQAGYRRSRKLVLEDGTCLSIKVVVRPPPLLLGLTYFYSQPLEAAG